MKRRQLLQQSGLMMAGLPFNRIEGSDDKRSRRTLRIAHISDVHIRDEDNAPERFMSCLEIIKKDRGIDFFLNTGDSIFDASYENVPREQVVNQWKIWDHCLQSISSHEVFSCIGNHDPWWATSKDDEMFGKNYAVKRLKIPNRYYSFRKRNWHFIALDGNNKDISLDEEQFIWLENELAGLAPSTPTLVMSHYPILGTTPMLVGGGHSDHKKLSALFFKHKDKVRICLSGHNHLADKCFYNGVWHCCNGAMSGFWWGKGDEHSAGPGYYLETPPGYAVLNLYEDGTVENEYIPHSF